MQRRPAHYNDWMNEPAHGGPIYPRRAVQSATDVYPFSDDLKLPAQPSGAEAIAAMFADLEQRRTWKREGW